MTIEQIENTISNMQIAELQRYNELLNRIKEIEEDNSTSPFQIALNDTLERVKKLEESRIKQITFNTSVTQKLAPTKEPEKPIDKPRWSFWR